MRRHVVSARLSDPEYQRLIDLARRRGLSLSDLVRDLVLYPGAQPPVTQPWPPGQYGHSSITVTAPANVTWIAA